MAAKKAAPKAPNGTQGAEQGPLSKLKAIYGFMTEHNLDTIELDDTGLRVKMVRRKAALPAQVPVPVYMNQASSAPNAPVAQQQAAPAPVPAGTIVKSTMMGIFYRAPTPSSPPYAKEGDLVKAGQVLCMIEAMKVFNEIKADFNCTVVKVLLENGKPVKSGQDIFVVARA